MFAPAARVVRRAGVGIPGGHRGRLDARPHGRLQRARSVRLLLAFPGPARLPCVERVLGPAGRGLDRPVGAGRGAGSVDLVDHAAPAARLKRAADAVQPAGAPADAGADQLAGRIEWPAYGRRATEPSRCPAPVTARSFRVTILRAAFPAGATAREQQARAVGIGSVSVAGLEAGRDPGERSPARAVRDGRGVGLRAPRAAGAAGHGRGARRRPAAAAPPPAAAAPPPRADGRRRAAHRLAPGPVQRRPAAAELAGAVACRGARLGRARGRRRATSARAR